MPSSGYSPQEQLRYIIEAARAVAQRTGTVRQTDLREQLVRMDSPVITETTVLAKLGLRVTDLKRHVVRGEPLLSRNDRTADAPVTLVPQDPGAPPDPEEIWERLSTHAEARINREIAQRFRSADLTSCGGPVGLLLMGDLHVGHQSVDYGRIDWCIEQVLRDDIPVRAIQVGDATDNLFWAVSDIQAQATEIPEQAVAVARVFGLMGDRLIGVVPGNHDQFGQNRTGQCIWDTVAALCPGLVYDPLELVLNITVGEIVYRWVVRHKVKGRSMYRSEHGVDKWHLFHDVHYDADAVVAGHIHSSGYAHRELKGKKRHGIQLGSYKSPDGIGDDYATKQGFAYGNYSPDMLAILHPDIRRIEVFEDTERGLTVLEALWAKKATASCRKKKATKKQTRKKTSGAKKTARRGGGSRSRSTGKTSGRGS